MKVGAIVQARSSSTRLPAKVLKELPPGSRITVLEQVIRRLKRSERLDCIIVATTTEERDDKIIEIAKSERVMHFRGSRDNVLSRFFLAAKENALELIVRVTSDCPCVDFKIVDFIIDEHKKRKDDYTSNSVKRTYPHGFDVEVFRFGALEKAYKNAGDSYEREHVTPYIYRNPDIFKISQVEAPKELFFPGIKVALDTKDDYALLCKVFDRLYPRNNYFSALDVVNIFRKDPSLNTVNKINFKET